MLFIKGNRIYTSSFSFEIPQGLSIVTDPVNIKIDMLTLETLDGRFTVEIGASDYNKMPASEIERLRNDKEVVLQSAVLSINRGEMMGFGVYFSGVEWRYEYYREFLEYPINEDGQASFIFTVEHEVEISREHGAIKEYLKQDNIVALLESIRYEPDVCKQVMQGN